MNKNPCRILLVDDEKHLAGAVARSLRDEGYEVLTAYDGPRAQFARPAEGAPRSMLEVERWMLNVRPP